MAVDMIARLMAMSAEGGSGSAVQADWEQTDTTAADYIKNKPTIPAAQVQADWNQTTTTAADYIKNKPTIPAAQVQSDWEQTDTTAADYIKNKPTLGAAAACGVDTAPASGSTNLITSGAVYTVVGDINTVLEEVL